MVKKGENSCVHCGADCGSHPVEWNEQPFCCHGCLTVYQLLNESKLYKYYDLEDNPGIRLETTGYGNKYEFLDKEEIQGLVEDFGRVAGHVKVAASMGWRSLPPTAISSSSFSRP